MYKRTEHYNYNYCVDKKRDLRFNIKSKIQPFKRLNYQFNNNI